MGTWVSLELGKVKGGEEEKRQPQKRQPQKRQPQKLQPHQLHRCLVQVGSWTASFPTAIRTIGQSLLVLQHRVLVSVYGSGWRWLSLHVWVGAFLWWAASENGGHGHWSTSLQRSPLSGIYIACHHLYPHCSLIYLYCPPASLSPPATIFIHACHPLWWLYRIWIGIHLSC